MAVYNFPNSKKLTWHTAKHFLISTSTHCVCANACSFFLLEATYIKLYIHISLYKPTDRINCVWPKFVNF